MLKILLNRLSNFLEWQILEEQAEFVPKKPDYKPDIYNIRQIIEKAIKFGNSTFLCFLDQSKAFDCVEWSRLWKVCYQTWEPSYTFCETCVLKQLYENNIGIVKVVQFLAGSLKSLFITTRVCQVCCNCRVCYLTNVVNTQLEKPWAAGKAVQLYSGGKTLNNFRYADEEREPRDGRVERVEQVCLRFGKTRSAKKNKMYGNRSYQQTRIHDVENVNEIVYLGVHINNNANSSVDVKKEEPRFPNRP